MMIFVEDGFVLSLSVEEVILFFFKDVVEFVMLFLFDFSIYIKFVFEEIWEMKKEDKVEKMEENVVLVIVVEDLLLIRVGRVVKKVVMYICIMIFFGLGLWFIY